MRAASLVVLVACTAAGDEPPVDAAPAAPPVHVRARVLVGEDLGALTIRVDGAPLAPARWWARTLDGGDALGPVRIEVELRDGAQRIDAVVLRPAAWARVCDDGTPLVELDVDWCALPHGELRFGSATVVHAGAACSVDGLCRPACTAGSCPSDRKCAPALSSLAPLYARLMCVPVGARQVGEACSWTRAGDDRYHDDCDALSTCVGGTCRAHCQTGTCTARDVTCQPPPRGFPPAPALCMPR